MILLSDELYELMLDNIEDNGIREQVFEKKVRLSNGDTTPLYDALKRDIDYWEDCIRNNPKTKNNECLLNHLHRYINDDKRLIDIFRTE